MYPIIKGFYLSNRCLLSELKSNLEAKEVGDLNFFDNWFSLVDEVDFAKACYIFDMNRVLRSFSLSDLLAFLFNGE